MSRRLINAKSLLVLLLVLVLGVGNHISQSQAQETASFDIRDDFRLRTLNNEVTFAIVPAELRYSQVYKLIERWEQELSFEPIPAEHKLWIKLSLYGELNSPKALALVLKNSTFDWVDTYILDDRERIIDTFRVGASRFDPSDKSKSLTPVIPFTLQPGQRLTIMVSIQDDDAAVVPVELWDSNEFASNLDNSMLLYGFVAGALGILFCYFLITYLIQRTPIRFWFAVSSLLIMVSLFSLYGMLGELIMVGVGSRVVSIVLSACSLFALAKVTHALLVRIPPPWRFANFVFPLLLLIWPLIEDSFQLTQAAILTSAVYLLLQFGLVGIFYDRRQLLPSRLYLFGWVLMTAVAGIELHRFINSIATTAFEYLPLAAVFIIAILLMALAIELKERSLQLRHFSMQERRINNLQQFYRLFRNSAEGLYTSTLDGQLMSVNPAMCSLFGYRDEEVMLADVVNTSVFYARNEDREVLVKELLETGRVTGREIKGVRADGSQFWFSLSCHIQEEGNDRFLYGSIIDITERKQSSISLEYLATHDSLTGVHNRREFERQLQAVLSKSPQEARQLVLMYLDLDRFKVVNDTCGHKAGDALIREIAQLLSDTVAGKGVLARLGGDEFALMLEGFDYDSAYLMGNKILNAVQEYRFIWDNRIFTLGVSIGLVECPKDIVSSEQLISMADAACYIAKEQGRNQLHRYSNQDESLQRYEQELDWIAHINKALADDSFVLFYQHYRSLSQSNLGHHYEILIRLRHPNGDIVPPNAFLPAAERFDLAAKIDRWVVEHTFKWLSENPEHCAKLETCNINLSGQSLGDRDQKLFILNAFEQYGIDYKKICFEITESMAIIKMDEALQFMRTFRQLGCVFALDDFGSGFSSYNYLKTLPVDYVKIDGSFVKDIMSDPVNMAMVASIKDVAKAMGMHTVAEFVEDDAVLAQLGQMGVDYAQGYGVAKPKALSEFTPL